MINEGNQLPSFRKEGYPTGGVVGKGWFDLFNIMIRIGVAKAAYFSYHLPLRGLTPSLLPRLSGESNLPEGGEFCYHSSFLILNSSFKQGNAPLNSHLSPTHFPDEPSFLGYRYVVSSTIATLFHQPLQHCFTNHCNIL